MSNRFIYIIEAECGLVKIGSSVAPETRFIQFAAYAMYAVRLIAKWHGDRSDEYDLHERFREHRGYNEWFRLDGDLAIFVESKRGHLIDYIPDWPSLAGASAGRRRADGRRKHSEAMKAKWADPVWRARHLAHLAACRLRTNSNYGARDV